MTDTSSTQDVTGLAHSNTVPRLLKAFGHSDEVAVGEREHDNLFVVLPLADGRTTVLR